MRRLKPIVIAIVAAACGGSTPSVPLPDDGPARAINELMQAVADSNLARVAELWGNTNGPAAKTSQPTGYQQRIQIMHAFLKGAGWEVLGELAREKDKVVHVVAITRESCRRDVPFTVVRDKEGDWLVSNIELGQVGAPGRSCPVDERKPPPA